MFVFLARIILKQAEIYCPCYLIMECFVEACICQRLASPEKQQDGLFEQMLKMMYVY